MYSAFCSYFFYFFLENVNTKYAVFALIWVGNMIYDTQLTTNIDATCTDISFNENFIFEDVNIQNFEMNIEIYSYEIFNTTTNSLISQSARKLAKHLTDFVRKTSLASSQSNNNSLSSSNSSGSSHQLNQQFQQQQQQHNDPYSYSSHRFKLCAQAKLKPADISEHVETHNLQLINETTSK